MLEELVDADEEDEVGRGGGGRDPEGRRGGGDDAVAAGISEFIVLRRDQACETMQAVVAQLQM